MSQSSRFLKSKQSDSQSQQQSIFAVKIVKKPALRKIKYLEVYTGRRKRHIWNKESISKYLLFLREYYDLFFKSYQQKRMIKVYHKMAQFIVSKSHLQCRIFHFQKLKCYSSVQNIIHGLSRFLYEKYGVKYNNNRYVNAEAIETQQGQHFRCNNQKVLEQSVNQMCAFISQKTIQCQIYTLLL